ncbi:MAG: phosphodiesterase [Clostridia bacterium]|nr:phosphodiesterase [Clostridia bacterium]
MRIMIASDIHGSARWCRALLEARERERPAKLLLLGDILYHGPRNPLPDEYAPARVAEMLNAIGSEILCVRGNCDSDVDQMVLDCPIMAEYCVVYAGGRMVFATHGHVFNEEAPPKLKKGDILLHGHTHVQVCREYDGYACVNPGSISLPKDGSWRGYMLLTDEGFIWKTLDGEEKMAMRF